MAFTVSDVRELLTLLREHPEWRAEVRREILGEELLTLPDLIRQNGEDIRELWAIVRQNGEDIRELQAIVRQNSEDIRELQAVVRQNSEDIRQNSADIRDLQAIVRQNSEDIRQNSAAIRDLQAIVRQNSEDIRQNSQDMRELQGIVRQNSADIQQHSAEIRDLVDAIRANTAEVAVLARRVGRMAGTLGSAAGQLAELRWTNAFSGRFGRRLRKAWLLTPRDLELFEAADDAGDLTEVEALAVRGLDLIVEGIEGRGPDARPALLAVEVSPTIEENDVERAALRAAVLRRVGYNAYAAVAGGRITPETDAIARGSAVEVFVVVEDTIEL